MTMRHAETVAIVEQGLPAVSFIRPSRRDIAGVLSPWCGLDGIYASARADLDVTVTSIR